MLCALACGLLSTAAGGPSTARAQATGRLETAAALRGSGHSAVASAVTVSGTEDRTHIELVVDRPIVASIFTIGDPSRTIVDIADLEFQLPVTAGRTGRGVIGGFRWGQFEPGRARIVLDAVAPVRIENAAFDPPAGRERGRLKFDLVRITAAEFADQVRAQSPAAPSRTAAAAPLRQSLIDDAPDAGKPGAKARPVIVIDPGHGGIDPGTIAGSNLTEKSVVLAVATQLSALLRQSRRFDVHMTRQDDVFVSLDRRLAVSQRLAADLFISIHADALAEKELAQAVRGATIYILSERASDETARRLAEKENAADVLAGLEAVPASDEDQVRNILIDLVRRETSSFAAEFRHGLVGALKGKVQLSKDPQRAAAFKVLKQAETPAVLIELGYMSNAEDLGRLSKPEWQRQVAGAIADAVELYFAQRSPKTSP